MTSKSKNKSISGKVALSYPILATRSMKLHQHIRDSFLVSTRRNDKLGALNDNDNDNDNEKL